MKKVLRKPYKLALLLAKKLTNYDRVLNENKALSERISVLETDYNFGWPKGHFYSPVHSLDDLKKYKVVKDRSVEKFTKAIPGFSKTHIEKELNSIKPYFKDFDYPLHENNTSRYYIKNPSYPTLDAVVLFSVLRKYKPKRVIEIGSGFTSGLMMDVNERFFKSKIDLTFIEPYPDTLHQRMNKADKKRYSVINKAVQDVPLSTFKKLKDGDILFVDSTHVSKFNSDVNYEIFDILPELNKGVIVHFHDVFNGFEYPLGWLKDGWAWNEDYLLRAFLMNNDKYQIMLMNDYMSNNHAKTLLDAYPREDENILNGGSLWLRKIS